MDAIGKEASEIWVILGNNAQYRKKMEGPFEHKDVCETLLNSRKNNAEGYMELALGVFSSEFRLLPGSNSTK
jgi:hypothetical protein